MSVFQCGIDHQIGWRAHSGTVTLHQFRDPQQIAFEPAAVAGLLAFAAAPQSVNTLLCGNLFAIRAPDGSTTIFTHDGHGRSTTLAPGVFNEFVAFAQGAA